jgi:hypothetical protein
MSPPSLRAPCHMRQPESLAVFGNRRLTAYCRGHLNQDCHSTAAAATAAAATSASAATAVTPKEHLGLPDRDDVKQVSRLRVPVTVACVEKKVGRESCCKDCLTHATHTSTDTHTNTPHTHTTRGGRV